MGELIIASEKWGLRAEDRIVVTLAATIRDIWDATKWPVTVLSTITHDGSVKFADEAGVAHVFATFDPTEPGFEVLRTQGHPMDVAIDPEYAERVRESAKRLDNWIVLDAHDEVVTDWDRAKKLIRAAFELQRERGGS